MCTRVGFQGYVTGGLKRKWGIMHGLDEENAEMGSSYIHVIPFILLNQLNFHLNRCYCCHIVYTTSNIQKQHMH